MHISERERLPLHHHTWLAVARAESINQEFKMPVLGRKNRKTSRFSNISAPEDLHALKLFRSINALSFYKKHLAQCHPHRHGYPIRYSVVLCRTQKSNQEFPSKKINFSARILFDCSMIPLCII